jgi:hypothetical protein
MDEQAATSVKIVEEQPISHEDSTDIIDGLIDWFAQHEEIQNFKLRAVKYFGDDTYQFEALSFDNQIMRVISVRRAPDQDLFVVGQIAGRRLEELFA